MTAFTSSSPRQPMEPVRHASKACNARRRSVLEAGWALTKDVAAASPKTTGAICRHASQSIQVESTKKSPGTFSGTRFLAFAMTDLRYLHFTAHRRYGREPPTGAGDAFSGRERK